MDVPVPSLGVTPETCATDGAGCTHLLPGMCSIADVRALFNFNLNIKYNFAWFLQHPELPFCDGFTLGLKVGGLETLKNQGKPQPTQERDAAVVRTPHQRSNFVLCLGTFINSSMYGNAEEQYA